MIFYTGSFGVRVTEDSDMRIRRWGNGKGM